MLAVATIRPRPSVNIARSTIATGNNSIDGCSRAPSGQKQQEQRAQRQHERHQADQNSRQRKHQLGQVDLPDQPLILNDADGAVVQADAQKAPGHHAGEQEERIVLDVLVQRRRKPTTKSPSSRAD